ncbi:intermediate filament protein [Elysia marginata]|uniref:Intermediate filament protein n=1 Tax=Elysia marginata TaxID=1093978 RepID=A0AAV4GKK4_9GAST|nr:intermediate filament protein [Elysia marginata]
MSQSFIRSSTTLPANSQISEKRTMITSSSGLGGGSGSTSGDADDDSVYYRSSITPRNSSITRPSLGQASPHRTSVSVSSNYHMPSSGSNQTAPAVSSFKTNREKEKKDMQDLNERFANYIEKVRFLEAQNKKLVKELEQLRSHWGKETSAVKQMYETELDEARKLIDDTNKEKARLQLRVGQLEEQSDDVMRQLDEAKKWRSQDRETINKLNQQLSELEGEIRMLRRTNDSLDAERLRDKQTIARLQEELEKLRVDLSNETIARLDAENKYQTLLEEIEFLKSIHEQELKELSALAYRDTTAENREFWKNELSQAIRDIQQEYDLKVDQIRGEMETFYNLKVQEFRTGATKQNMEVTHAREEVKKLQKMLSDSRGRLADLEARNAQLEKQYQDLMRELEQKEHDHLLETNSLKEEMNKLRAEMEGMLVELQTLMDAKLSLELEIAAYRKLLEHEESRIPLRSSLRHFPSSRQFGGNYKVSASGGNSTVYPSGDPTLSRNATPGTSGRFSSSVATLADASSHPATPQKRDSAESRPKSPVQTGSGSRSDLNGCKFDSTVEKHKDDPDLVPIQATDVFVKSSNSLVNAEPKTHGEKGSMRVTEDPKLNTGHVKKYEFEGTNRENFVREDEESKFGINKVEKDQVDGRHTSKAEINPIHKGDSIETGDALLTATSREKYEPSGLSQGKDVEIEKTMMARGDDEMEITEPALTNRTVGDAQNSVNKIAAINEIPETSAVEKQETVPSVTNQAHVVPDQARNTSNSEELYTVNADLEVGRESPKAHAHFDDNIIPLEKVNVTVKEQQTPLQRKEFEAKEAVLEQDTCSISKEPKKAPIIEEYEIESAKHVDLQNAPSFKDDQVDTSFGDAYPKSNDIHPPVLYGSSLIRKDEIVLGDTSDDDSLCIQTMAEYDDETEERLDEDAGEALAESGDGTVIKVFSKRKEEQSGELVTPEHGASSKKEALLSGTKTQGLPESEWVMGTTKGSSDMVSAKTDVEVFPKDVPGDEENSEVRKTDLVFNNSSNRDDTITTPRNNLISQGNTEVDSVSELGGKESNQASDDNVSVENVTDKNLFRVKETPTPTKVVSVRGEANPESVLLKEEVIGKPERFSEMEETIVIPKHVGLNKEAKATEESSSIEREDNSTTEPVSLDAKRKSFPESALDKVEDDGTYESVIVNKTTETLFEPASRKQEIKSTFEPVSVNEETEATTESIPVDEDTKSANEPVPMKEEIKTNAEPLSTKEKIKVTPESVSLKGETEPTVTGKEEIKATTEPLSTKVEAQVTLEPVPVKEETKATDEPLLINEEIKVKTESVPVKKEIKVTTEFVPVKEEIKATTENAPVKEEIKATTESVSVKEEIKATDEPLSTNKEIKATNEPAAVKEEIKTTTEPVAEEIKTTTEPAAVKEEIKTTTEPSAVQEEIKATTEPAAVKEDIKTTTEPVAKKEEIQTTTEPVAVKEEIKTTSEPAAVKEEIKTTLEPVAVKEEIIATTEPAAVKEEIETTTEPVSVRENTETTAHHSLTKEAKEITKDPVSQMETSKASTKHVLVSEEVKALTEEDKTNTESVSEKEKSKPESEIASEKEEIIGFSEPLSQKKTLQTTHEPISSPPESQTTAEPITVKEITKTTPETVLKNKETKTTIEPFPVMDESKATYESVPMEDVMKTTYESVPMEDEMKTTFESVPMEDVMKTTYEFVPMEDEMKTAHEPESHGEGIQATSEHVSVKDEIKNITDSVPMKEAIKAITEPFVGKKETQATTESVSVKEETKATPESVAIKDELKTSAAPVPAPVKEGIKATTEPVSTAGENQVPTESVSVKGERKTTHTPEYAEEGSKVTVEALSVTKEPESDDAKPVLIKDVANVISEPVSLKEESNTNTESVPTREIAKAATTGPVSVEDEIKATTESASIKEEAQVLPETDRVKSENQISHEPLSEKEATQKSVSVKEEITKTTPTTGSETLKAEATIELVAVKEAIQTTPHGHNSVKEGTQDIPGAVVVRSETQATTEPILLKEETAAVSEPVPEKEETAVARKDDFSVKEETKVIAEPVPMDEKTKVTTVKEETKTTATSDTNLDKKETKYSHQPVAIESEVKAFSDPVSVKEETKTIVEPFPVKEETKPTVEPVSVNNQEIKANPELVSEREETNAMAEPVFINGETKIPPNTLFTEHPKETSTEHVLVKNVSGLSSEPCFEREHQNNDRSTDSAIGVASESIKEETDSAKNTSVVEIHHSTRELIDGRENLSSEPGVQNKAIAFADGEHEEKPDTRLNDIVPNQAYVNDTTSYMQTSRANADDHLDLRSASDKNDLDIKNNHQDEELSVAKCTGGFLHEEENSTPALLNSKLATKPDSTVTDPVIDSRGEAADECRNKDEVRDEMSQMQTSGDDVILFKTFALSQASASLLAESFPGQLMEEAQQPAEDLNDTVCQQTAMGDVQRAETPKSISDNKIMERAVRDRNTEPKVNKQANETVIYHTYPQNETTKQSFRVNAPNMIESVGSSGTDSFQNISTDKLNFEARNQDKTVILETNNLVSNLKESSYDSQIADTLKNVDTFVELNEKPTEVSSTQKVDVMYNQISPDGENIENEEKTSPRTTEADKKANSPGDKIEMSGEERNLPSQVSISTTGVDNKEGELNEIVDEEKSESFSLNTNLNQKSSASGISNSSNTIVDTFPCWPDDLKERNKELNLSKQGSETESTRFKMESEQIPDATEAFKFQRGGADLNQFMSNASMETGMHFNNRGENSRAQASLHGTIHSFGKDQASDTVGQILSDQFDDFNQEQTDSFFKSETPGKIFSLTQTYQGQPIADYQGEKSRKPVTHTQKEKTGSEKSTELVETEVKGQSQNGDTVSKITLVTKSSAETGEPRLGASVTSDLVETFENKDSGDSSFSSLEKNNIMSGSVSSLEDEKPVSKNLRLESSPGRFEAVRTKTVAETVSGEGPVYVTTYQESHSARQFDPSSKFGLQKGEPTDDVLTISFSGSNPNVQVTTLKHDKPRPEQRYAGAGVSGSDKIEHASTQRADRM